ncbi:hypothetical protein [uncultured Corynebacterium sp.]|uniref:hypothetical protein n=1 Tax=uncultured Corynebacterium sp. TaxID=159447 RepID=UPI0025D0A8B5|nr:hypothetical protein [uncultured Corynebacterium sp.]
MTFREDADNGFFDYAVDLGGAVVEVSDIGTDLVPDYLSNEQQALAALDPDLILSSDVRHKDWSQGLATRTGTTSSPASRSGRRTRPSNGSTISPTGQDASATASRTQTAATSLTPMSASSASGTPTRSASTVRTRSPARC